MLPADGMRTVSLNADRLHHEIEALAAISEAPAPVVTRKEAGLAAKKMISRAYHDSLFIAHLCPTAMIFIPCRGGVSHRPDEYSSPEQIAKGVLVLARTLENLASRD